MGLTCTSLSFKGATQDSVEYAVRTYLPRHKCFISPESQGWITVVDEECDEGPTSTIVETAGTICRACECPGIVLGILHSNFLFYWLFDAKGQLVDFSYPKDFDCATDVERAGLMGAPERIATLCLPGVTGQDIRRVLTQPGTLLYERLSELERLLGLPEGNVSLSYNYLVTNADVLTDKDVENWSSFIVIP